MDDFVYWDSIGGHVEDQARPANRQNGVRSPFELRLSTVIENLQGALKKCTNRKKIVTKIEHCRAKFYHVHDLGGLDSTLS